MVDSIPTTDGSSEGGRKDPAARYSWDLWLDRQPTWVRLLILPIFIPVAVLYSAIAIPVLIVVLAKWCVSDWIAHRRYYNELKQRGQVMKWRDAESPLAAGSATLIVVVAPGGAGFAWLLEAPPSEIGVHGVLPNWHRFEEEGWIDSDLFDLDLVSRWSAERLAPFATTARAIAISRKQLARLSGDAKCLSVFAFPCLCRLPFDTAES